MAAEGKKDITPYWRTLKVGGALNEKYPGGAVAQAGLLESEGHKIISDKSGNPKKVKDFEKTLIEV
jgi:hypothetical protein